MPNLAKIIAKIDAYEDILAIIKTTYQDNIDYETLQALSDQVTRAQEKADKEYSESSAEEASSSEDPSSPIAIRAKELTHYERRLANACSMITDKLHMLVASLPSSRAPSDSQAPESTYGDTTPPAVAVAAKAPSPDQDDTHYLKTLKNEIEYHRTAIDRNSTIGKDMCADPVELEGTATFLTVIEEQLATIKSQLETILLEKAKRAETHTAAEVSVFRELRELQESLQVEINRLPPLRASILAQEQALLASGQHIEDSADHTPLLDSPTSLPSPITRFTSLPTIAETAGDPGRGETQASDRVLDVVVDNSLVLDRLGNKRLLAVSAKLPLKRSQSDDVSPQSGNHGSLLGMQGPTAKASDILPPVLPLRSEVSTPLSCSAESSDSESCSEEETNYKASRDLLAYVLKHGVNAEGNRARSLKTLDAAKAVLTQVEMLKKQGEPTGLLTEVLEGTHTLLHTEGANISEYTSLAKNRVQGHGSPAMMFLGKLMLCLTAIFAAVVLCAPSILAGTLAGVAGVSSFGFFAKGRDTGLARRMNTLSNSVEAAKPKTPKEEEYPLTVTFTVG